VNTVTEGSTTWVSVAFLDREGVPQAPATISYRVDCLTTGTVMLAATSATPTGTTLTVRVPGNLNRIVNRTNATEVRRLTVKAGYGVDDELVGSVDWFVAPLPFP
jgi:hypothetical protein